MGGVADTPGTMGSVIDVRHDSQLSRSVCCDDAVELDSARVGVLRERRDLGTLKVPESLLSASGVDGAFALLEPANS